MKRRERRRRLEGGQELIITSMVDTFTLLLTFLLNFVNPDDPGAGALLLPTSLETAAVPRGAVLAVTPRDVRVDDVPVILLEGSAADVHLPAGAIGPDGLVGAVQGPLADALAALPTADAASPGGEPALLVECDKAVPYVVISQLLATARAAGFRQFHLVVEGGAERAP